MGLPYEQCVVDGVLVVGGDYDFALTEVFQNGFEICQVVFGGVFEGVGHWVLIAVGLGQPGLLHYICSSDQFGTEFQVFMPGQPDFIVSALDRPLKVVLDGGNNIGTNTVVSFLQLFRNGLYSLLHVALLGVHQNSEVVLVLASQSTT